jgi:deoxycytidylate deaminase
MDKNKDPRELVVQLLKRSQCAVQVGAVIANDWGVHYWGWNSSGPTGYGQHAEAHAIERACKDRWMTVAWDPENRIYVAARRKRNGRIVTAKPCEECRKLIDKYRLRVVYRDGNGVWCG